MNDELWNDERVGLLQATLYLAREAERMGYTEAAAKLMGAYEAIPCDDATPSKIQFNN